VEAGVAACVNRYVADQVARGWRVSVLCPGESWLSEAVVTAGADFVPWRASRGPGPATAVETADLRRELRRLRPDVLHLHSSKAGLAGRLAARGRVSTVLQPHAWSFEPLSGPMRSAAVSWERLAARWAARIVCVSDAERRAGVAAGIAGRYAVVPNGVDLSAFLPADDAGRSQARARLGIGPEPLAVCVGRLSRQKGQDQLLAVWPQVRAHVPDARLALVGDGPLAGALAARLPAEGSRSTAAGDVGGVSLLGATSDVRSWLAAADVVVCPSRYEGMALVPLEAMATGRSVVASRIPANVEAVPTAAGSTVDLSNTDGRQFADAIVARLRSRPKADHEGLAGRRHVEQHHDLARNLDQLVRVYRELCPAVAA
jgi:glycosyltransferase involved in cell wall biosynthesis